MRINLFSEFPTWLDTNRAIQPQKTARDLTFRIQEGKVPKRGTLIFFIYIRWADFLGVVIFKFNIFGGFQQKKKLFWVGDFCGYSFVVPSKSDCLYG